MWKVDRVWPYTGVNPHSYIESFSASGLDGANKKFNNNNIKIKIGKKIKSINSVFIYVFKIKLDIIAILFNNNSGLNIKIIIKIVNIPIKKLCILLNIVFRFFTSK